MQIGGFARRLSSRLSLRIQYFCRHCRISAAPPDSPGISRAQVCVVRKNWNRLSLKTQRAALHFFIVGPDIDFLIRLYIADNR